MRTILVLSTSKTKNLAKRSYETDFATTNQVKEVDQKKPC